MTHCVGAEILLLVLWYKVSPTKPIARYAKRKKKYAIGKNYILLINWLGVMPNCCRNANEKLLTLE
jgi:hypothetical protein